VTRAPVPSQFRRARARAADTRGIARSHSYGRWHSRTSGIDARTDPWTWFPSVPVRAGHTDGYRDRTGGGSIRRSTEKSRLPRNNAAAIRRRSSHAGRSAGGFGHTPRPQVAARGLRAKDGVTDAFRPGRLRPSIRDGGRRPPGRRGVHDGRHRREVDARRRACHVCRRHEGRQRERRPGYDAIAARGDPRRRAASRGGDPGRDRFRVHGLSRRLSRAHAGASARPRPPDPSTSAGGRDLLRPDEPFLLRLLREPPGPPGERRRASTPSFLRRETG
jgi:hypothetical protein